MHLSQLFERQVKKSPEATALIHGRTRWTYRDLNILANQFARYLKRQGVVPETRVVVCGERSLDLIAVLLAVAKAGGVYVPLEPDAPPGRVANILASSGARMFVALKRAPEQGSFGGKKIILDEHADDIRSEDTGDFEPGGDPENLFAILFTSGTTGTPKGILIRESSAVRLLTSMGARFPFNQGDTFLLHRSFSIIGSLWEYFGPMVHGVPGVLLTGDDARDPETIWAHLIEQRITHVIASPTLGDAIIRYGERHGLESSALRSGVLGGEPIGRRTIDGWKRRFPQGKLFLYYGITETMYLAFFDTSLLSWRDERIPAGQLFPMPEIRVLDDALECVKDGQLGEIYVSGPCLARGYLNSPSLTAERFVPNPWGSEPGSVMYRTGDLGLWRSDGLLELRGRRDRQVKIRGFRVELDEVEAAVRQVSNALKVAVVLSSDSNGRQQLVAYLETDADIAAEDLRRSLRRIIPDHMVPAAFVAIPSIPLNNGGKADRAALAQYVSAERLRRV